MSDPRHVDHCEHGPDSYRGTCVEELNGLTVDVYVFEDSTGERNVCLRFGNRPEDYYSTFGGERLREVYGDAVAELAGEKGKQT